MYEADVVLDSLQMGQSWYNAWRLQRAMLGIEKNNGESLQRELTSERTARKKSDDLFVETDIKLDTCMDENATLRIRVGGRFWLGVGLGGAAVAGTLLLLK